MMVAGWKLYVQSSVPRPPSTFPEHQLVPLLPTSRDCKIILCRPFSLQPEICGAENHRELRHVHSSPASTWQLTNAWESRLPREWTDKGNLLSFFGPFLTVLDSGRLFTPITSSWKYQGELYLPEDLSLCIGPRPVTPVLDAPLS